MAQIRSKQISDFLSAITWANVTNADNVKIANVWDIKQKFNEVDTDVTSLESYISAEVVSLEAIDAGLAADILTEKGRIDAILDASTADADQFAEIVSLINSVDTENDDAFAGYVTSNNASIDSLEAVDVDLQSQITSNDGQLTSLDTRVTADEAALAAEITRATNREDAIEDALNAEIGATNADFILVNSSIDSLEGDVASLDTRVDGLGNRDAEQDDSIDSLEAALQAEIDETIVEQRAQDASIDSLEVVDGVLIGKVNSLDTRVATDEEALANEIDRATTREDEIEAALNAEIAATNADFTVVNASIDSLEVVDAGLSSEISTEKGRIDAILLAADADKDSFAEIVSLINSVDASNDSAFAGYVTTNNASIDSLEAVDSDLQRQITANDNDITSLDTRVTADEAALAAEITRATNREDEIEAALEAEINATNADFVLDRASIDSLEVVDAGLASDIGSVDTRITGVEGDLAAEITRAGSVETVLSDALAAEILSTNAEQLAQDASIDSLEVAVTEGGTYLRQTAVFSATNVFTIPQAVAFGANDDLSVYVNGVFVDFRCTGTEVDFTGMLNYDVDKNDKVQVMGIKA